MPFGIGLHGFIFFDCSLFRRLNPFSLPTSALNSAAGQVGQILLVERRTAPCPGLIRLGSFMQRGHAPCKGTLGLAKSHVDLYNVLIH